MNDASYSIEVLAWAKQRLDELDAIIVGIEKSVAAQSEAARAEADKASARLKAARLAFQHQHDALRSDADNLKQKAKSVRNALDEEWIEVESSLHSFLAAIANETGAVRSFAVARADAQRRSWMASLVSFGARATETLDRSRQEFEVATRRLSEEAEKLQARIADTKDAGDESWAAVKEGLAEAKAVQDRTMEKIKTSISKLF
jgi:hypothetical protein